jgi:hypothetical protein
MPINPSETLPLNVEHLEICTGNRDDFYLMGCARKMPRPRSSDLRHHSLPPSLHIIHFEEYHEGQDLSIDFRDPDDIAEWITRECWIRVRWALENLMTCFVHVQCTQITFHREGYQHTVSEHRTEKEIVPAAGLSYDHEARS